MGQPGGLPSMGSHSQTRLKQLSSSSSRVQIDFSYLKFILCSPQDLHLKNTRKCINSPNTVEPRPLRPQMKSNDLFFILLASPYCLMKCFFILPILFSNKSLNVLLLLSHFSRVRLCVTPCTSRVSILPSHFRFLYYIKKALVALSCQTLCNPMDCSPPGTSVHGMLILQTKILKWITMPFSKGSSRHKDLTHVSYVSCIGTQVLYHSVSQSCLTPCDPWTAACQASLSITTCQSLLKLMSIELVMPSIHLILCHSLIFLPSIFPSIGVFFNESVLQVAKVLELQLQHQSFQ